MASTQPPSNDSAPSSQKDAAKQRNNSLPAASVTGQYRNTSSSDADVVDSPRLTLPNSNSSFTAPAQGTRRSTPANLSAPSSTANSTLSSRESSPVRPTPRLLGPSQQSRSQRTSANSSPSRQSGSVGGMTASVSSLSSATAVQNAFNSVPQPELPPASTDAVATDASQANGTSMPPPSTTSTSQNTQPSAGRRSLKGSPSPSSRQRASRSNENTSRSPAPGGRNSRIADSDLTPANTSSKLASVSPPEGDQTPNSSDIGDNEPPTRGMARGSARNASVGGTTLETVQEASLPSTPMADKILRGIAEQSSSAQHGESEAAKQSTESGSESGGNKSSDAVEDKPRQSSVASPMSEILPKRSFTSLNQTRGKGGDSSVRNMIVETETVSSIPQVSLGVGASDRAGSTRNDQGGTVRMKPSNETIKPKKEKRKTHRKPATAGTVSSKADIFEAKVASAVDEADVSDSDETFVYESNPPEPHPARQHRHHSRTPSTTSMVSQLDQFGGRSSRGAIRDGPSVTGKRSMKFTNNYNNLDDELGDGESARGSGRGENYGPGGRHHHAPRHGRNNGAYPPLFDQDTSSTQSQPSRSLRHHIGSGFRPPRRGNNSRSYRDYRTIPVPKNMSDTYLDDFDADGADDERTPLVGSVRLPRSRNGRRPNSASLRQMEYLEQRQRNCFSRYGGCVIAIFLVMLLVGGAATFVVALTKPLLAVHVTKIHNVLATEQELILDLEVSAINPNIFAITVGNLDVDIFASSRYVGSEKFWREHGPQPDGFPRVQDSRRRSELAQIARRAIRSTPDAPLPPSTDLRPMDGVDHGTDPMPEDPSGDPSMLLGRVYDFDSPLIFDPAPWRRIHTRSTGQIRLSRPGNKTEAGGTERWERVLQHQFQLIVRGTVKYTLPLSSKLLSAPISAKKQVTSEDDDGSDGGHGPHRNDTVSITALLKKPAPSTTHASLPVVKTTSAS